MALPEIQEKLITAADLWELSHRPENEGKRFELSEGILIAMAPAGLKHGGFTLRLGRWVGDFVDEHQLGMTTAAETGFILYTDENGKDTVRAPDVGFIAAARLPKDLPDGYAPFAPDLAIEVVSPGDSADEIEAKVNEYLKYGVRLVWVFYPKTKTVMVRTPSTVEHIDVNGALDGGNVLPGFKLSVRDVFSE
jgi:Uma2 family endonuclease